MELDRRIVLGAGLMSAAALSSSCTSGRNEAGEEPSNLPNLYQVSDPAENLEAFVKVMGNLSGEPVWFTAQGAIYLIREGEMPLPLLGVIGLRYARFEAIDGGYRQYTRDWGVYLDYDTGELLSHFDNPVSGKRVPPSPLLTRFYGWDILAESGQHMQEYSGEAWMKGRPFSMPWVREGNDIAVTLQLLVKYSSGIGGGEWMNLMTSVDELNDPKLLATSCRLQWTGHSPIMRWLDMPNTKGRTLWNSMGRKHASLQSISARFKSQVAGAFPGSLDNPEGFEK